MQFEIRYPEMMKGDSSADACRPHYRDDYWGAKTNANGDTAATAATTHETVATDPPTGAPAVGFADDGDVDMAE